MNRKLLSYEFFPPFSLVVSRREVVQYQLTSRHLIMKCTGTGTTVDGVVGYVE